MTWLAKELKRRGIAQAAVAKAAGVHPAQVTRWARWGMPIPAEHIPAITELTGIPVEKLRPPARSRKGEAA